MKILLAALLALAACRGPAGPGLALRFQKAQEAFDSAASADDFLLAARRFEALLAEGVPSATILYDLGNAYARAGERGRAVAAYEQARRLRPRDPYLENNLRLARAGAPSFDEAGRSLVDSLLIWKRWMSPGEQALLTGLLGTLAFLLGTAALWLRRGRRTVARLAVASVAASLLAGAAWGVTLREQAPGARGVVIEDRVVARSGNADTYQPAFTAPLAEGTGFQVLELRGDWVHLRLPAGPEGWVRKRATALY